MSSIFSRNIPPECLKNIIEFVKEGPNPNLYSCMLVNREWMKNCLPLLWNRPFDISIPVQNGTKLMNTYISCLDEIQKQYLIDNDIYLRQNRTPQINYPAYLRELDYEIFEKYTRFWLIENIYSDRASDLDTIAESLESTEIEYTNNQLKKLLPCLFSMFIEKSNNLTHFSFYSDGEMCLDIPELPTWMVSTATYSTTNNSLIVSSSHVLRTSPAASKNSNFLKNLTTFKCEVNDSELHLPNLITFMEILSLRCKMLQTIIFTWRSLYDTNVHNYLREIVRQQQQLRVIRVNYSNINISRVDEIFQLENIKILNTDN
ncbi:unnamed protein product [Rhizophagus irregularis]|uniref:F-box domain-containing protein n=1 Tax=Rhizophagus irregularis TaxID=588596 RepID=A0A2N1NX63_9GLOM|nr:hypothetical protein RhiirC2_729866 [Rhizophagus irregularis]CAB4390402.1 unnamed protein product [Rhizophagus irregularis]CAB5370551.1 unnamed protein product [Rhizophagus irregularis]